MAIRKSPHPERARNAQSKGARCTSQRAFQFFYTLECGASLSLGKRDSLSDCGYLNSKALLRSLAAASREPSGTKP
jgi:hypothetical protein